MMGVGNLLKEIYILYGSQTGNSEYIAKDVYKQCIDAGIRCQCLPLNSVKGVELKDVALGLVVVCSTTGNGDCPENADNWWRAIKLRKVPKDTFQDIPYCVLGLGDTNYDKFCYMGKTLDKRLHELGAVRLLDLVCADEAVGLEDAVEDWKYRAVPLLINLYKEALATEAGIDDVHSVSGSEISDTKDGAGQSDFDLTLELVNSASKKCESSPECSPTHSEPIQYRQSAVLQGTMTPSQICSWLDLTRVLTTKPNPATAPRSPRSEMQICRFGFIDKGLPEGCSSISKSSSAGSLNNEKEGVASTRSSSSQSPNQEIEYTLDNPFISKVLSARWLTTKHNDHKKELEGSPSWGEAKRVIEMKVSVNDKIPYNPGDALGFVVPNPSFAVKVVYDRLVEYYSKNSDPDLESGFSMTTTIFDTCNHSKMTAEEFLTWRLDLTGPLKKSSLYQLAKYCSDPSDATFIEWLCNRAPEGQQLWTQFVESQRLGIAEFLALLPSCCPPLSALVTSTIPMVPRYYSAASSPLVDSLSCAVAFSIHRHQCGVTVPNCITNEAAPKLCRYGLATSYFEQLLAPWLRMPESKLSSSSFSSPIKATGSVEAPVAEVRIFLKPTPTFRPPGSAATPLLLIGPGTGVAPFIGFLDHRRQLEIIQDRSACGISTGVWRGFDLDDLPSESLFKFHGASGRDKGKILLFFGCRTSHDYIYRDKLEEHLQLGTLSQLDVAFSRVTEHKEYVTHRLLQYSEEIAALILEQHCCVYICGDGNNMAKDVYNTIKTILMNSTFCNGSETKAVEFINDMKQRRRYLQDIWG